jgi:cytochrome c6
MGKSKCLILITLHINHLTMKGFIMKGFIWVALGSVLFNSPLFAADGNLQNGAKIFKARCATCHEKGKNLVNTKKQLTKTDLEKNAMFNVDNIALQIKGGKGSMPSFNKVLKQQEIDDVAAYVFSQAEKGWK